ncbi:MAG: hypothetical protein ABGX25_01825 [Nautiliaceae bacterium]
MANVVSDKKRLNKMNKIMLKETLHKLHRKLNDKDFRKEFTDLFIDYLDVNNRDSNAHYHKILKILENAGFDREEAEDFFKEIRVNNKDTIVKLSKLQSEIQRADEQFKTNYWKIMSNPLSVKNMAVLYLNVYKELHAEFKKMTEELKLKFKVNGEMQKQIKKIEKILGDNVKGLEKIAKGEEFLILDKAHKDANNIREIFEEMKAELLKNDFTNHYIKKTEQDITQDISKVGAPEQVEIEEAIENVGKDLKEEKENPEKEEVLIEDNESPKAENPENELKKDLDNCLKAVVNDLDNTDKLDKKTMSFYVLSEYLHAYNRADFSELYEEFKDVLEPKEFAAIVTANEAAMNNDLSYERMEKMFQESGIMAIVKMVQNLMEKDKEEGKKYAELMKNVEEKIAGSKGVADSRKELDKEEKELTLGQPVKKQKALNGPGF